MNLFPVLPADQPCCGIDEAGRGPWAGPVVAAAVILPDGFDLVGIDDSKALTARARAQAFDRILAECRVGVGQASVAEIDALNILRATMLAMARAVFRLGVTPALALVDGNRAPELPCPVRTVVGGDAQVPAIAAASIVAKVTRDRIMVDLDRDHPAYRWASNKGYGTADHAAALKIWGVTAHHRTSFAPIAKLLPEDSSANY